jgi:glycosyltransferase involved in cell wall biosynthesis
MKLSIIVPIYNVEAYLRRCVDSILSQTFTDFELILVDDGSPDACGKICDEYALQDKRIRVIHKKNGGLSDARNAVLDVAKGEYIGFVDSDDAVSPEMYQKLMEEMEASGADVVTTGFLHFDESGNIVSRCPSLGSEKRYTRKDYIDNFFPCIKWEVAASACNKLYRRGIFDQIRYPVGKLYEDSIVQLPLLDLCDKIVILPRHDYHYYLRQNSIMNYAFSRKNFQRIDAALLQYTFFVNKKNKEQQEHALAYYVTQYMIGYFGAYASDSDTKAEFISYKKEFFRLLGKILTNPQICKLKKLNVLLMYINHRSALRLAQKFFPESLPDFLRITNG